MTKRRFIAVDQYGQTVNYASTSARKGLLDALGARHADKVYRDDPLTGAVVHCGYIVQRRWFAIAALLEDDALTGRPTS